MNYSYPKKMWESCLSDTITVGFIMNMTYSLIDATNICKNSLFYRYIYKHT